MRILQQPNQPCQRRPKVRRNLTQQQRRRREFLVFDLVVDCATGLDTSKSRDPRYGVYRVLVSDETGYESHKVTVGKPQPAWNHKFSIRYDQTPPMFVYLDIVEENCYKDPGAGTSSGGILRGKARVMVPHELDVKSSQKIELVKMENCEKMFGGFVFVQFKLSKHVTIDID